MTWIAFFPSKFQAHQRLLVCRISIMVKKDCNLSIVTPISKVEKKQRLNIFDLQKIESFDTTASIIELFEEIHSRLN